MQAHGAAPGELGGELRGGDIEGNARSIAQLGLRETIVARLADEGVTSLEQWRALGAGRKKIFGIVPSVVRQLDQLSERLLTVRAPLRGVEYKRSAAKKWRLCRTCRAAVNPPAVFCYDCSRRAIREELAALKIDAGRQVDWLTQKVPT